MPTFFINSDSFKASNAFVATLGAAPGSTYLGQILAAGLPTAANAILSAMTATTAAGRADAIAANLGLTGTAATTASNYLQTVAFAGAASTHGQGLLSALDLFANLQNDATFGTAATAYVSRVNTALSYSSIAANNSTDLTTLAAVVGSAGSTGGSTFSLTTATDNWSGTAGNDVVNAVIHSTAANGTLALGDLLDAKGGTDSITVNLVGTTPDLSATTSPTLTGFETLEIKPLAGASTANLNIAPSMTKLLVTGPIGTFTITNAPAAALDVTLTSIATDNADQSYTWKSGGLTGSADALTLRVDSLSASDTTTAANFATLTLNGATTSQGFETLNVVASGSASRLDSLTVSDGTTSTISKLVVTGSANFRVNTALADTVRTIDSSGSTGGVNVGVTAGFDVTLVGGDGNDRINMAGGLTNTDVLNGGAGTDTLAISQTDGFTASTDTIVKAIKAQTGFERLEFTNTDLDTVKLSALSGIDYFTVSGAQAENLDLTGVENADTVAISASFNISAAAAKTSSSTANAGTDAINVAPDLDGGTNTFNLVLNGFNVIGQAGGAIGAGSTGDTGGAGGDAIDAPTIEIVNITSTGTTASATNKLEGGDGGTASAGTAGTAGEGLIIGSNSTVNITGANDLTIESLVGSNVTVNAGAFTGKLVVRVQDLGTGDSNDVITGGSGNDTITAGDGVDTIDLTKGGSDTVNLTAVTTSRTEGASIAAITTAASRDIITGFTAGSPSGYDILDLDLSVGTTNLAAVTAAATAYTLTATNAVTEYSFAATLNSANLNSSTNGSELLKGLGAAGALSGLTVTANDTGYIVAYDGTDAFLYYYADGGDTTLAASEINLIGILRGVATGAITDSNLT